MADNPNLTLEGLPDDVTALVRGAADSISGYPGDLAAIARRGTARRRWYVAGISGAAAVLALVAVAAPVLVGVARSPVRTPPAGPLINWPQGQALPVLFNGPSGCRIGAVLPGGTLRWIPVPLKPPQPYTSPTPGGASTGGICGNSRMGLIMAAWPRPRALPDGRFFFGLAAQYFAGPTAFVVVNQDGTNVLRHDLARGDLLFGADERDAFAIRGDSVVAYALATGAARVLYAFPADDPMRYVNRIDNEDIAAGRLAWTTAQTDGDACVAWVREVRTGTPVARLDLTKLYPGGTINNASPCDPGLRLSADGRMLAAAYRRLADEQWVGVLDVASGRLLVNVHVPWPAPAACSIATPNLAWLAPRQVRVAWIRSSSLRDCDFNKPEMMLHTYTVRVPEPNGHASEPIGPPGVSPS